MGAFSRDSGGVALGVNFPTQCLLGSFSQDLPHLSLCERDRKDWKTWEGTGTKARHLWAYLGGTYYCSFVCSFAFLLGWHPDFDFFFSAWNSKLVFPETSNIGNYDCCPPPTGCRRLLISCYHLRFGALIRAATCQQFLQRPKKTQKWTYSFCTQEPNFWPSWQAVGSSVSCIPLWISVYNVDSSWGTLRYRP